MNELDKFVNSQNIIRYAELLSGEPDRGKSQVLRNMLVQEEDRFGFYSEKLVTLNQQITRSKACIVRQQELVRKLRDRDKGSDTAEQVLGRAEQVLAKMESLKRLFEDAELRALEGLDRNSPI